MNYPHLASPKNVTHHHQIVPAHLRYSRRFCDTFRSDGWPWSGTPRTVSTAGRDGATAGRIVLRQPQWRFFGPTECTPPRYPTTRQYIFIHTLAPNYVIVAAPSVATMAVAAAAAAPSKYRYVLPLCCCYTNATRLVRIQRGRACAPWTRTLCTHAHIHIIHTPTLVHGQTRAHARVLNTYAPSCTTASVERTPTGLARNSLIRRRIHYY